MRTPYEFAVMQLTRFRLVRWRAVSFSFLRLRQKQTLPLCNALRGCKHCFRRTHAYCVAKVAVLPTILLSSAARRGKGISGAPQPT